jgi:cytochrome c-type biogenesis protein CcmH
MRPRHRARLPRWLERLATALCLMLVCTPALAFEPDEVLADKPLEARARALSQALRCLVCQNQSIDDSNAPLARDLRKIVRERLTAGDSDDAVLAFVEARYGEFVLLRPRFNAHTVLLWLAPLALVLASGLVLWRRARARLSSDPRATAPAALTAAERARLEALLEGE